MLGSFSEEALFKYSEMVSQTQSADFSEGESYDFTRCMRPNGSIYGTRGQCRKGTETTKETVKPKRASNVQDAIDIISEHPALKKFYNQGASYDDLHASVPIKALEKHLGWGSKELSAISKGTEDYEGTITRDGDRINFYGGA